MKIAVPYWEGKVSPVLDTSTRLLVIGFDGEKEVSRYEVPLSASDLGRRCNDIKESGAHVLICGAVSRPLYRMLEAARVEVIPWISGEVEEVISAYFGQTLNHEKFLMPGCRWQGGRGKGGRKMGMKQCRARRQTL